MWLAEIPGQKDSCRRVGNHALTPNGTDFGTVGAIRVAEWRKPNGTHFTEPQTLAAFKNPSFLLTRLAPAAQI